MKLTYSAHIACLTFVVVVSAAGPAVAKKKPVRIRPTSEKMMNLGAGVDIAAHKSVGSATCVQFKKVNEKGTRKSSYDYKFTEHASDVRKAMDLDMAVGVGYQGVVVSVQAKNRTQWMKGRSVSTLKRILLAQALVPAPTYVAQGGRGKLYPALKKEALEILKKSGWSAFKKHCGTGFVSRVYHQHRYVGLAEFDLSNKEIMKSLRNTTSVNARYATIKAQVDVDVGTEFWQKTKNVSLSINIEADGFDNFGAPKTLDELHRNVNAWMRQAGKNPRRAAAYDVEVTPYELLPSVQKFKYKPVQHTNLKALEVVADATWEMQSFIDSVNAILENPRMFASTGWARDLRTARDTASRLKRAGAAAFAACHKRRAQQGKVDPACRVLGRMWSDQKILRGYMKLASMLPAVRSQCTVKVTGLGKPKTYSVSSIGGPQLTKWFEQRLRMKSDGKKRKWDSTFKGSKKNRLRIELTLERVDNREFVITERVWLTEGDVKRLRKTEATRHKLLRVKASGGCTFKDAPQTIARWGLRQGGRPPRFEGWFKGNNHDQYWSRQGRGPSWLESVTLNFGRGVKTFAPVYRAEPRLALLSREDGYTAAALKRFRDHIKRFSSKIIFASAAAKKVTKKSRAPAKKKVNKRTTPRRRTVPKTTMRPVPVRKKTKGATRTPRRSRRTSSKD